jgi:5-formyltetrahydrofolate cyclo-ligase
VAIGDSRSLGELEGAKQVVRNRMWKLLEAKGAVKEMGVAGYIPDFDGGEAAAERLAEVEEWRRAKVIKANPDGAQLAVRARALMDGKRVYMAVPRLARDKPFVLLDPARLSANPAEAAAHQVATAIGQPVDVGEMDPVDLIVCGSVAVNLQGVRLGKGGGYSDLEMALLNEAGLLKLTTPAATTVHQLQVVDEELPEADHDFRVNLIVTPLAVMRMPFHHGPPSIMWDRLDAARIADIPALYRRSPRDRGVDL